MDELDGILLLSTYLFSQPLGAEHRGYTASGGAGRVIQDDNLMLSSQLNSLESRVTLN